jgi:hypothetical protein
MQRIDQLSGGRQPFSRGNILWCWTHCGQMAPLGARPRLVCAHGPALTRMTQTRADELPSPQDIYNELKPVLGIIVAGELATTVKVGQELRGAGVGPLPPLGDGSHAALQKLLTYVQQSCPARSGLARTQRFPGKFLYVHPEELSQTECLFGFSQCSTRVGDLRFAQPFVPEHTGCKVR